MVKILIILASITLTFVVVKIYCAKFVKGHSNQNENNSVDNKECINRRICSKCRTGKNTYDMDPKSENCPYIECIKNGECSFYVPLEKTSEKGTLKN